MPSATIKLFLVHGDEKRLRTAELSNWTGKAVAGPRSELDGVLANLTKPHVRYLEGWLIEQAKPAGRALVMNGQSSGSRLPESDREDMEIFLERIHQLMPVLGADALLPIGPAPEGSAEKQILRCEIKGLTATGRLTPTGFVVLKGSQAVFKERASAHQYPHTLVSRRRLIEDGTLAEDGDHLKFTRDSEFTSPSAAATVVHGGSANGLLAWKTASGKTLKELEAI
jgi:hypothetical protein